MMLRTADGGAVVHALDLGSTRKPLPRWVWMAAAASVALHAAGGVWLYQRKFVAPPIVEAPGEIVHTIEIIDLPKPKPEPIEATPPKPPTPIHKTKPSPVKPPMTLPLDPPETPPIVSSGEPRIVAPSPVYDPASTTVEPVAAPPPKVIQNPKWISKPSSDQLARWYPLDALEKGVGGRVVMACQVTAAGSVTNCAVTSEDPAGEGFGAASVKLARYFKMSPRTEDGAPVEGGMVNITLRFGVK